MALSNSHNALTTTNWSGAKIEDLLLDACRPFCDVRTRIVPRGEPIELPPRAAVLWGMIFHELATNAAKYGALSSPNGRLAVSWTVANGIRPPTLCINWQETGGPLVKRPDHAGFGSRLVERGITHQLHGCAKLDYDPSGLRCTMEIPLASMPG